MFELDERLQRDTLALGDFPLCRLLLMNDARFPWFILVPRRNHIQEIFDLSGAEQPLLWREVTSLTQNLYLALKADKMNVASLGNLVPQLHVHVVARYRNDPAWPEPVWGTPDPLPYETVQMQKVSEVLEGFLGTEFDWITSGRTTK
jgi:diadenosine tetraphosphate (Ap4A) HIT family hydrolase